MMEANFNTTDISETAPELIPDTSIKLIPAIRTQVFTTIMIPSAFGFPIMREDFIIGTGPLRDARPIKQL